MALEQKHWAVSTLLGECTNQVSSTSNRSPRRTTLNDRAALGCTGLDVGGVRNGASLVAVDGCTAAATARYTAADAHLNHLDKHGGAEPTLPQLISELCTHFYHLGWVTGTGGSISVRRGGRIFMAPSGVQKERMLPGVKQSWRLLRHCHLRLVFTHSSFDATPIAQSTCLCWTRMAS